MFFQRVGDRYASEAFYAFITELPGNTNTNWSAVPDGKLRSVFRPGEDVGEGHSGPLLQGKANLLRQLEV